METAEEREQRVAAIREQYLTRVAEMNQEMAQQAAVDRCDHCPEPKSQRDDVVMLPNGVRMSVWGAHCQQPGPNCTASVCSHLVSELSEVANRMVEHLVAVPELVAVGVSWLACLAPSEDRLILTYRVPEAARVATAVGRLPLEVFRQQRQVEPGDTPDPPAIPSASTKSSHPL